MTAAAPMRVLRLGAGLRSRLEAGLGGPGRVHSVFARAVNIEWADGRLLTLHGRGPLLAPFAAAVEETAALRALRPGDAVRQAPGLLVAGSVPLGWKDAQVVDLSPARTAPGRNPLGSALQTLREPYGAGLDSPLGIRARRHLAAGIRRREPRALIAGGRALLGLGEGLTPSGDDCLVGVLAVLHRFAGDLGEEPDVVAALSEAAHHRTTALGREFVLHALAGLFSEAVIAVVAAPSREDADRAVAELQQLGATSGADTLRGMRLAWHALAA